MHPTLIEIYGVQITTYGFMIAVSFAVMWLLSVHRGKKLGYSEDFIQNLLAVIVLSAFIFARSLHVIIYWDEYSGRPSRILFSREGYVFLGGFVGAVLCSMAYCYAKGVKMMSMADLIFPYLALAQGIGRIGCFLFGCCYGGLCTMPWGVQFPKDSPAFIDHYNHGLLDFNATHSLPVHPTQIYESLFSFAHFGILLLIQKNQTFRGQVAVCYLMIYSVGRFIIEIFRGDERGSLAGWLSTSQFISVVLFLTGLAAYFWLQRQAQPPDRVIEPEPMPQEDPQPVASKRRAR